MEQTALITVFLLLLSLLACSLCSDLPRTVMLPHSGSVSLCEGEIVHILCIDVNTSVQWNITGMHKEYNNNSNPVCLGPVSSTDNGATVECEAVGHKSLSTRLLVGPPDCGLDVRSMFTPTNRSLFIWWTLGPCKSASPTAFVVEWTYPKGYGTSGNISSAMYVIPNVEPLKEYAITVSLINRCGRGTVGKTITFGSPIVVGILLGMVLIVFLTLAMIISIAPACYRNIKANMKGKADQYERLENENLLESIELKVSAAHSSSQNGCDARLESIADAEADASTSL